MQRLCSEVCDFPGRQEALALKHNRAGCDFRLVHGRSDHVAKGLIDVVVVGEKIELVLRSEHAA